MSAAVDCSADSSPSSATPTHARLRTCVGCRERDEPSALVRVAALAATDSGPDQPPRWRVEPDVRRRLPGRGAWLHPRMQCLEGAVRRQAFARALRVPAPVDITVLQQWYAQNVDASTDASSQEKNRKRV